MSKRASLTGFPDPKREALVHGLFETLRQAGARFCNEETTYIDRDFSSAYAAFYATLYKPYTKYCRRIHFFAAEHHNVGEVDQNAGRMAEWLERHKGAYLGYVVIRPLEHAPVSHAVVSGRHVGRPQTEISVRSKFRVHILGVELEVEGTPVTEQDRRTGACAQAAMWTAARHLHNQHGAPWFSMTDITEAALRQADTAVTRALPAGSDHLTADSMVRALREMGERPKVYGRNDNGEWETSPTAAIARYLDSGVPVIIGLTHGEGDGHAVVAIGTRRQEALRPPSKGQVQRTTADGITHFIVHDDQRGPYRTLPLSPHGNSSETIPFHSTLKLMRTSSRAWPRSVRRHSPPSRTFRTARPHQACRRRHRRDCDLHALGFHPVRSP